MLLVSRRRLSGLDHAAHVEIGPVGDDDAGRILAGYAGSDRADAGTVRELVRLCDGVPLALRIVGGWLASGNVPPAMLAQHLRNRPLDGLVLDDLSVRGALATEYRTVAEQDPVAARALPALGSLEPGATTTPEELAVRLGEDPSLVFFALERLIAAWLVQSPTPGRYGVTGLTRAYAVEMWNRPREDNGG